MYYSLTRRKPVEHEQDNKRLTKDITKIFGIIARKLVAEIANPFVFKEHEIESNGTRRSKTLRFLHQAGILRYAIRTKTEYSYKTEWNFEEAFMEHSKEYAIPDTFPDVPFRIEDYLKNREVKSTSSYRISEDTFETEGYREIDSLPLAEAIYIYWNINDYDIRRKTEINKNYNPPRVLKYASLYPKAKLILRQKALLKMLVKKYSETDFKTFMEKRFGDNYDGQIEVPDTYDHKDDEAIKDNDIFFNITLRNFAKFPKTFEEALRGFLSRKGYIAEYKRKSERATFEYNRLKRLVEQVHAAGGCAAIAKEYIQECCNEIVSKAPLLISGDDGDKLALQHILDNRDVFKYDYIYS